MANPAAVQGDQIVAVDTHIVLVPAPPGPPVPTPLPHPFSGPILQNLSMNVRIMRKQAAVVGSMASNSPPHLPTPPGTAFSAGMPTNQGRIVMGSSTVRINGKAAARITDQVETCAEPIPNRGGRIVPNGLCTVRIGG